MVAKTSMLSFTDDNPLCIIGVRQIPMPAHHCFVISLSLSQPVPTCLNFCSKTKTPRRGFVVLGNVLYRRSFDRTNLRCDDTAQQTIHETHAGACGGHINGHALAKRTS